jgi:phospholipase C
VYDPLLPDHDLVYNWLTDRAIRWRVYHEGLPFFAMMPRWWSQVVDNELFRPFDQFRDDILNAGDDFPQVIFLEPTYTDAPHLGNSSDDHAPSAIHFGQEFLSKAYEAVTLNEDVWAKTVMVITYDEHGGFFDHVNPPAVITDPPHPDAYDPFQTLGVRVPSFVVSPFVSPGAICHEQLDHTSVLKFLAELFGKGQGYLPSVDERAVQSVSVALDRDTARADVPAAPSLVDYLKTAPGQLVGFTPGTTPTTPIPAGFKAALDGIRDMHGEQAVQKFGDLMDKFPKSQVAVGVPGS